MTENERVIDRINELFIATDDKAWPRVLACFTQDVMFDMSSLVGTPPARLASRDIVAAWEKGLAPIEKVHHQAGNYRIDVHGNEATAFCYGTAYHFRRTRSGNNARLFVGSYEFHLVENGGEWRIDGFKFNCKFVDGNLHLEND